MLPSLLLVFGVFCLIMGTVLAVCLRERKRALANQTIDARRDAAADTRVALILFGAMIAGVLLALITAYLVFFRQWR